MNTFILLAFLSNGTWAKTDGYYNSLADCSIRISEIVTSAPKYNKNQFYCVSNKDYLDARLGKWLGGSK